MRVLLDKEISEEGISQQRDHLNVNMEYYDAAEEKLPLRNNDKSLTLLFRMLYRCFQNEYELIEKIPEYEGPEHDRQGRDLNKIYIKNEI